MGVFIFGLYILGLGGFLLGEVFVIENGRRIKRWGALLCCYGCHYYIAMGVIIILVSIRLCAYICVKFGKSVALQSCGE